MRYGGRRRCDGRYLRGRHLIRNILIGSCGGGRSGARSNAGSSGAGRIAGAGAGRIARSAAAGVAGAGSRIAGSAAARITGTANSVAGIAGSAAGVAGTCRVTGVVALIGTAITVIHAYTIDMNMSAIIVSMWILP
jgi:hypothetical protein